MTASFPSRVPRTVATTLLNPRMLATLAFVGANLIWGGSAAASKPVVERIPPLTTASIRVAIALVVLCVILRYRHERVATGMAPALLGLTGVALSVVLLGEPLSLSQVLGGLLVVAGVGIASRRKQGDWGGARLRTIDTRPITPVIARPWSSLTR